MLDDGDRQVGRGRRSATTTMKRIKTHVSEFRDLGKEPIFPCYPRAVIPGETVRDREESEFLLCLLIGSDCARFWGKRYFLFIFWLICLFGRGHKDGVSLGCF